MIGDSVIITVEVVISDEQTFESGPWGFSSESISNGLYLKELTCQRGLVCVIIRITGVYWTPRKDVLNGWHP